ncbi:Zinc metalloproteinase nas-14 [Orchesella cincta]|uniref:Zinc metalloproteinase nas-14 n=1 Tax=Orchesella cincta TaxID=48709 RepID=A0A1D2M7I8_ORCCI|nr:Zinc metalloproteinase nas-14 [Orchesella cincta]
MNIPQFVFVLTSLFATLPWVSTTEDNVFECNNSECESSDTRTNLFLFKANQRTFQKWTKWPKGIVPSELQVSLSADNRLEVQNALDEIESKTCIRFQRRGNEADYVTIRRIWGCSNMGIFIHELGHSLCLIHEHIRPDRDDYLDFKIFRANEIPPKANNIATVVRYTSVMHYPLWIVFGWWMAKDEWSGVLLNVKSQTLCSVLDADKPKMTIRSCQGCFTHRWRPIENLTPEDRKNMVSFGSGKSFGDPYYLCRGYVWGAIHAGKYWAKSGICYLSYNGREHFITNRAQVFTLPGGNMQTTSGSTYDTVWMNSTNISLAETGDILYKAVKVGRKVGGIECFAAVAEIYENEKGKERAIGTVCKDNLNRAYFPESGREYVRSEY